MNQLSKDNSLESFDNLYNSIKEVLNKSRQQAYQAVNSSMLLAYWTIGQLIVEDEQDGQDRAEYGKQILEKLSDKLVNEFGTSFSVRNLWYMKKFYQTFRNVNALRSQLTWTHYRSLLRVKTDEARNWYIEEAVKEHWSSRQLDRQISTMYYERLLSSQDKNEVVAEANDKLKDIIPEQFIKKPLFAQWRSIAM